MSDIEVYIDFAGGQRRVGTLHRHARRVNEAISFEYHAEWLATSERFSLEPALKLHRGAFVPPAGLAVFGSIGDSAPDTWGRRLMQRAERKRAKLEGRSARTLLELDYLLGVADISRLGALRFRTSGEENFQAEASASVPSLLKLGQLLNATERVLRDEDLDEDIQIILAPGSSLGGARPKASVVDSQGRLAIAKFPKETDDYSLERWECVALCLATKAGIRTSKTELIQTDGKPVLLSRRFDRDGAVRVPFLSALSMLELKDGSRASYPELVEILVEHGAQAASDVHELYRRMVFNVLISNVDDHLRNHGFLWLTTRGWTLSPAYDLNPTPVDVRKRILTTNINLDEGTCDLDLVCSVAEYFNLGPVPARKIIREVAAVTSTWRSTAAAYGAPPREVERVASAFEHADLQQALRLGDR